MNPLFIKSLQSLKNKRALLMLSGGGDSALCLALLKKHNIPTEAIHFRHKWMWRLSTNEAKRIAKKFKTKIHIFDISKDFFNRFNGFMDGRPCRLCKPIMYKKTIRWALKHNFGLICVGDNKYDTIVERIKKYENKKRITDLFITKYLDCINEGVKIPKNINIVRPVINLSPSQIKVSLKNYHIIIKKNHETGDKYFKYWREGCPMQYNEAGTPFTRQRMNDLYKYNLIATNYAKKKNLRVSVHLPSGKIITIPKGHEEKIKKILIKKSKINL